jgi:hypothetical protein
MTRMLEALRQVDDRVLVPIPPAASGSIDRGAAESGAVKQDSPILVERESGPSPRCVVADPEIGKIATGLLERFPPGRPAVLLFASPEPDGAATVVVAALATALAPLVTGEILAVDGNARWSSPLEEMRRAYQFVLVDASAAENSTAQALAPLADGVFLVIRLGHTGRRAAGKAAKALRQAGGRLLGCVLAADDM